MLLKSGDDTSPSPHKHYTFQTYKRSTSSALAELLSPATIPQQTTLWMSNDRIYTETPACSTHLEEMKRPWTWQKNKTIIMIDANEMLRAQGSLV